MHPDISELPSKVFYDSRLKDGPGMAEKTKAVWHKTPIYGPYHFINVNGQETKSGTSTRNTDEARVAVDLYRNLERQYGSEVNFTMRIGVITMYREQLMELKRQFRNVFGEDIVERIEWVLSGRLSLTVQLQHRRRFPRPREGYYHSVLCPFGA